MHLRLSFAALAAAFLVLAGCTVGSGDLAAESRDVAGFDEVVLLTSGDVQLDVTGNESLEIEADDNILPLLTSNVVNGRLELGSTGSFSTSKGITYTITAADLVGITVLGSGDVEASGIDSDSFEARIDGSGDIRLFGTAVDLNVAINGSGEFNGNDLEAVTGTVAVAGSGDAVVNVTGDLRVNISGSGDVQYLGNPALTQSVSGSGDVSRR